MFAAGIFFVLLITQRSFMQFQDAYTQGVFRLLELRNQADSIVSGEGFSFWSWYEGPGTDEPLENFIEIGSIIGALFPAKYVELGLTVAALIRMYLGGAAFIFMGIENGLKEKQNLVGSLLYVFSACFIGMAIRQSEMLVNAYFFPLLVGTVDRIYKKKSPIPFILVVAYYMAVAVYNAYMSAIVIVIYIIFRYFYYNDKFKLKSYTSCMGKFILCGLAGMMLSAGTSIFSMATIKRASTDSSLDSSGLLFSMKQYLIFGKMILGSAATYDYLDIGIPIAILILIPIAIRKCTRRSTNVIMTALLFVMMMIPFFSSMLNGFGYVSFRWSYTLLFFAVWSGAEQLDADTFKDKKNLMLGFAAWLVIGIWAVGPNLLGLTSIGISGKFFWLVQLAAGLALLFVLKKGASDEAFNKTTILVMLISLTSLSLGWSAGFFGNRENFAKPGTVMKRLDASTLRVSDQIEDEGFYRIDSVDGINRHAELRFPANENIWWKSNNLFIYNSRIPETLTEFNIDTGNSYGYARRVYVLSNGNRMGLDFIYGVRYFLGNDTKKKGYEDSDNYAGYGFELKENIDGVNVFKNKYDVGLGFVYPKAISEEDFDKLDSLEKEQALMQAAVVSDKEIEENPDIKVVKASELEYAIDDVAYEIEDIKDLEVGDKKIKVKKGGASFAISAKDIPNSQLLVSFDNLLRGSENGTDSDPYEIYASDGKVNREVIAIKSRQGVDNLVNHDLNMGHYKGDAKIKVTFERKGTYTFDGIHLYAMSTALYDKLATNCMDNALNVSEYSNGGVTGSIDSKEGGVLFLSIPVHESWDVYIDGVKADPIENLDGTFLGAYVPAGKHEVRLDYNNRYVKLGSLISLFGLVLMGGLFWYNKRVAEKDGLNRESDKSA